MLRHTNYIRTIFLSSMLLLFGSQAFASPIIWHLDNVRFEDGGKLEGLFTFDWPTIPNVVVHIEEFNFIVSGGNEVVFPPVTYTPDDVNIAFYAANPADPVIPPLGYFVFNLEAPTPFGRDRSLRIAPTLPLDGTFDVVPLLTAFDLPRPGGLGREECFSCAPSRLITSGNLIPEPTTLALLSLGFAGIGFTQTKMKAKYDSK